MGVVMSPSSGFCQSSKNREEEEIHGDWGRRAGNWPSEGKDMKVGSTHGVSVHLGNTEHLPCA